MICHTRTRQPRLSTSRRRLRLESLETRRLLSTLSPSDISGLSAPLVSAIIEPIGAIDLSQTDLYESVSDPTEIAQLDDPTTPTLVLDFNSSTPIQPFDLNGGDVSVSQGGVQIGNASGLPLPELTDQNNGELIVPLIEQNADYDGWQPIPLPPGSYQIALVGGSGLALSLEGFSPSAFNDQNLAQMTILGQGASFATIPAANDLGTLGPTIQTVSDQMLNPEDPASSVQLYEFTLAPGHYWQVGAAISAASIGSPLATDLSLFDSQGDLLATSTSGTGLANDPSDPYLFSGLAPGTYYIGVSGAGNLPYSSTNLYGYNLQTGQPGLWGTMQRPGTWPFDLDLVASTADQPTTVTGFTLDSVNPQGAGPSGFTVSFSGPIDANEAFTIDAQQSALEVVDSSGRIWPTTATNYQVNGSQLTMIFDQALSPGVYSLIVPAQGGLTDLAGITVVSPSSTTDVLARWDIQPSVSLEPSGPHANNVGVLWPLAADVTWPSPHAQLQGTAQIAAGQSVSYQFDIIVPAYYELEVEIPAGQALVTISGANGNSLYDQENLNSLQYDFVHLVSGSYTLTFTALGSESASLTWILKPSRVDYEAITLNGVGQGNALSFWLTTSTGSPSSFAPSEGGVPSPGGGSSAATGLAPGANGESSQLGLFSTSASQSATSILVPASPIPNSLLVTLDTNVVGLPSGNALNVAAVGPMVESGMVAVADQSNGAMPGIRYGASSELEPPAPSSPEPSDLAAANQPASPAKTEKVATVAARDPEAASLGADRRALAQAEWLVRLATQLGKQFGLPQSEMPATAVPAATSKLADSPMLVQVPSTRGKTPPNAGSTANTGGLDAGFPAGVVVVAAVLYHMRRPLRRWWRARHDIPSLNGAEQLALGHGPHHRFLGATTKRHSAFGHSPSMISPTR